MKRNFYECYSIVWESRRKPENGFVGNCPWREIFTPQLALVVRSLGKTVI